MFIRVEEKKLSLWLEVISNEFPLDYISIGPLERRPFANRRYENGLFRTIYLMNESQTTTDISRKVSELAYKKGLIQNLTKKENPYVREILNEIPTKVCPSTGETCQHDNGSGHCMREGESRGSVSESHDSWHDSVSGVREKDWSYTDQLLREMEADGDLDCL